MIKNARRKLESPTPATMLCRTLANCSGETCRTVGENKTKHACIVEVDEIVTIRLECVLHRYHEDHIVVKGITIF